VFEAREETGAKLQEIGSATVSGKARNAKSVVNGRQDSPLDGAISLLARHARSMARAVPASAAALRARSGRRISVLAIQGTVPESGLHDALIVLAVRILVPMILVSAVRHLEVVPRSVAVATVQRFLIALATRVAATAQTDSQRNSMIAPRERLALRPRAALPISAAKEASGPREASPIERAVENDQRDLRNSAIVPVKVPDADLGQTAADNPVADARAARGRPDLGREVEVQETNVRLVDREQVVIRQSQTAESGTDVPDTLSSSLRSSDVCG
jgi:hypothetical protein